MRNVTPPSILPRSIKSLLLIGSLLALAPHIHASGNQALPEDTQWYEVNIVIFKQNTPGFQNEQWRDREQLSLQFPHSTVMLDDDSYDNINFGDIELEPYIPDDSLLGVGLTRNGVPLVPTPVQPTTLPTTPKQAATMVDEPLTAEEEAFFANNLLVSPA